MLNVTQVLPFCTECIFNTTHIYYWGLPGITSNRLKTLFKKFTVCKNDMLNKKFQLKKILFSPLAVLSLNTPMYYNNLSWFLKHNCIIFDSTSNALGKMVDAQNHLSLRLLRVRTENHLCT